ncbi:MAG: hypothetical protein CW338_09225 [Clostridiales bacterium]|nr:hypothetical protein [Clostridiales bacterium]
MEKRKKTILLVCSAVVAALIGTIMYAYGFSKTCASTGDTVFHSLLAVCKMFIGRNEMDALKDVEFFSNPAVLTVFWMGHFLAFFVTSATTISALGSGLLTMIRITKIRRGTLLLVYGSSPSAVSYAARQMKENRKTVLFVDDECSAGQEANINAAGALLSCSEEALHPDRTFLKKISINPGSRRLELALFQSYPLKNLEYAKSMLAALKDTGISPAQTSLTLRGIDETDAQELMADENHYGYGQVYAFNEYEVAARLMVRTRPPCDVISFDKNGRATGDFRAVIVGFGKMGMAVLEQLIMNGQFYGAGFSVDIFDPNPQNGVLFGSELMKQYTIRFHACDANSQEFYSFLQENKCNYIVQSTGNESDNFSLDASLRKWYRGKDSCPDILLCTKQGTLESFNAKGTNAYRNIYESDAMDVDRMDRAAMQINQHYCKNGLSAEENWKSCNYFSRLSCRAAADFYPAMLRAAGRTEEGAANGDWDLSDEMLENLARTEHMRWCAFHYVMGYKAMDEKTFEERAKKYLDQKQEKNASSANPGKKEDDKPNKDTTNRLHACLIPWEELKALSEKETALTGIHKDYWQNDRDVVLAVPEIIREIMK